MSWRTYTDGDAIVTVHEQSVLIQDATGRHGAVLGGRVRDGVARVTRAHDGFVPFTQGQREALRRALKGIGGAHNTDEAVDALVCWVGCDEHHSHPDLTCGDCRGRSLVGEAP